MHEVAKTPGGLVVNKQCMCDEKLRVVYETYASDHNARRRKQYVFDFIYEIERLSYKHSFRE